MSDQSEDIREFRLVELKKTGAWWYEYDVHPFSGKMAYLNFVGSGFDETGKEKVLRTVKAESFEDLDWSETSLIQPTSDAGWLDRAGRFHGCYSTDHDIYARYVLKKEVSELEETGWVRVYTKKKDADMQWFIDPGNKGIRLTVEQKMWLDRNGYILNKWDD